MVLCVYGRWSIGRVVTRRSDATFWIEETEAISGMGRHLLELGDGGHALHPHDG